MAGDSQALPLLGEAAVTSLAWSPRPPAPSRLTAQEGGNRGFAPHSLGIIQAGRGLGEGASGFRGSG